MHEFHVVSGRETVLNLWDTKRGSSKMFDAASRGPPIFRSYIISRQFTRPQQVFANAPRLRLFFYAATRKSIYDIPFLSNFAETFHANL